MYKESSCSEVSGKFFGVDKESLSTGSASRKMLSEGNSRDVLPTKPGSAETMAHLPIIDIEDLHEHMHAPGRASDVFDEVGLLKALDQNRSIEERREELVEAGCTIGALTRHELTRSQKQELVDLEVNLYKGDYDAVYKQLVKHTDDPRALIAVAEAAREDLAKMGIQLDFGVKKLNGDTQAESFHLFLSSGGEDVTMKTYSPPLVIDRAGGKSVTEKMYDFFIEGSNLD